MRSIRKLFCLAIVGLILVLPGVQAFAEVSASPSQLAEAGVNLMINPSFELPDGPTIGNWKFSKWDTGGGVLSKDSAVFRTGKNSAKISNLTEGHSRITQQFIVEPNTTYHFSVYVKVSNVSSAANSGQFGANITIENSKNAFSNFVSGTINEWKQLELYATTDDKTQKIGVQLALGSFGSTVTGTAIFDDVFVEKVQFAPSGAVNNVVEFITSSSTTDAAASSNILTLLGILALILVFVGGVAGFFIYSAKKKQSKIVKTSTNPRVSGNNRNSRAPKTVLPQQAINETLSVEPEKFKFKVYDFIIMGVCVLLYGVLTFNNLGSMSVPETNWTTQADNDSFVVELPQKISPTKIGLYLGYGNAQFNFEYMDDKGQFVSFGSLPKVEGEIFKWSYVQGSVPVDKPTNKFRITAQNVGYYSTNKDFTTPYGDAYHNGALNEMAFFDSNNNQFPIKDVKITDIVKGDPTLDYSNQNPSNLFDEQNKVSSYANYFNGTYFDEIYHARTAYENIHNLPVYETTHPPLGKVIISLGIRTFGMNPFGWRFMGAFFGLLMLPLMYLFGLKLFRRRFFAFAAMFLISVDFMHFSLTRIATIDTYGTFFVLLMYYFMYDYFVSKSVNIGYKKSLMPLLFCGIAFGLGAASKWIGLYAAAGLALLFFLTKYQEYKQFNKLTLKWKSAKNGWVKDFIPLYLTRTMLWSLVFFIVIPLTIYIGSYVPSYLNVPGAKFSVVAENQISMYKYHSGLTNKEERASKWFEWPLDIKPLDVTTFGSSVYPDQVKLSNSSLYGQITSGLSKTSDNPANFTSKIFFMGNPGIFWVGIIAFFLAIYFAIKRRSRGMAVVLIAITFQIVPWMAVSRITYIYHIFSSVPFIIFCIIYSLSCLYEKKTALSNFVLFLGIPYVIDGFCFIGNSVSNVIRKKNNQKPLPVKLINWDFLYKGLALKIHLIAYLAICLLLFAMFYPILSGFPVETLYISNYLSWFKDNLSLGPIFKWNF